MPETIKQFTNGAVTESSLAADGATFSIFTNNNSTTRVVRDIQVQDSDIKPADATFEVGGTTVGDTFEDSSGTVVVPPSASLDFKLKTPVVPATKQSLNMRHHRRYSSSKEDLTPITGYEIAGTSDPRFPYDFSGASFSTTTTTGTAQDFLPPLDSDAFPGDNYRTNIYQVPTEKTYYYFLVDDNSYSRFGKYVYSNNGDPGDSASHTLFSTNSYAGPAIDWQGSRMFLKEGPNIKEYNLLRSGGIPNSTPDITHGNFFSTQSSYGTGAYSNNHYFYAYNGQLYVRNLEISTGNGYASVGGNQGSYPRLLVLYNESENRFYVLFGYNTRDNARLYYFDAAQTTSAQTNYGLNATSISSNFNSYMNSLTGGSSNNFGSSNYLWNCETVDTNLISVPYDNNSTRLYKAENGNLVYTGTSITITSDNSAFPNNNNWRGVTPVGAASSTKTNLPNSGYTISTKVRTEGVEIT